MSARMHSALRTNPPIKVGWGGIGRWGSALRKGFHSTCLYLKISTNLLETLFGCVRARILSYTTPEASQHAYACQHALMRKPNKPPRECGWRGMGRWGSAHHHGRMLHSPHSQAFVEFTGNIIQMRACTHTVLHFAPCVPARLRPCLLRMRASTHSFGTPDKLPRECG